MQSKARFPNVIFGASLRPQGATLAILLMILFLVFAITLTAQTAQAQSFKVIYFFGGGVDGWYPEGDLALDPAGNLYGTTTSSDYGYGDGTVFKLKNQGDVGWILTELYTFPGGSDGSGPFGGVTRTPDGTLLGGTYGGGEVPCLGLGGGCGVIFHLAPSPTAPRSALAAWNETVLYTFTGGNGWAPEGDLTFDQSGNIYGTTLKGGNDSGVVYELTPSGGGWTERVLYSPSDSAFPYGGVVFDRAGNLYCVFQQGDPYGWGAVYQLSPSGSGWTEQTLHGFTDGIDGGYPAGGLIIDPAGNLYGTTSSGGSGGGGTVFELTPTNGGWTFNTLYSFTGSLWGGPRAKLVLDAAGNFYGTTYSDGAYGSGSVFRLTSSNGSWTYTSLHDFTVSDGGGPQGSLIFDANGNLYGTTSGGGVGCQPSGCGVVWEITP